MLLAPTPQFLSKVKRHPDLLSLHEYLKGGKIARRTYCGAKKALRKRF